MGTKRYKPEDVVAKLRQADVSISQDQSVAEATGSNASAQSVSVVRS